MQRDHDGSLFCHCCWPLPYSPHKKHDRHWQYFLLHLNPMIQQIMQPTIHNLLEPSVAFVDDAAIHGCIVIGEADRDRSILYCHFHCHNVSCDISCWHGIHAISFCSDDNDNAILPSFVFVPYVGAGHGGGPIVVVTVFTGVDASDIYFLSKVHPSLAFVEMVNL